MSQEQIAGPSLHDDFLDTLQATGMLPYAMQIDMIQDGQIPDVKGAEELRGWPMDGSQPADAPGLSEDELRAGEMVANEAQNACQDAIEAAEQVKKRQKDSMENYMDDDLSGLATPSKRHKSSRRGGGLRSAEGGGRSGSKGLRHFSMKVCEKVEGKGRTTYNEVADELVTDLPNGNDPSSPGGMQYDEKNIRRRVYDALNVLMAMGIITKEKKEIFWKGLPQGPQLSLDRLKGERQRLLQKLDQQRRYIAELTIQQQQYRALMRRNRGQTLDQLMLRNATGSTDVTALPLPFVLIQVDRSATIEIQIADDNRQAEFDFDASPFKITGDEQVLQEMALVDQKEPIVFRASHAATDAMSPRPMHHSQAKLGLASASNRAHPQMPPPMKNMRPALNSPAPFNLANLPHAAQLAALNMANIRDPTLLGSLAAAARGTDWIRSPPGLLQGSPNFRIPNSPLMLRPGLANGVQPTLAQQLAMSFNPNNMLGPMPGGQNASPRGLLLGAASQPGAGLSQWGNFGPSSNIGNHARMLHGNDPLPSSLPNSVNQPLGGGPSRPLGTNLPSTTGANTPTCQPADSQAQPSASQQLPSSLPQIMSNIGLPNMQLASQKPFSQEGLKPMSDLLRGVAPDSTSSVPSTSQSGMGLGSMGNSVLNAAWLSSFQRSGVPSSNLGSQLPASSLPPNAAQQPTPATGINAASWRSQS